MENENQVVGWQNKWLAGMVLMGFKGAYSNKPLDLRMSEAGKEIDVPEVIAKVDDLKHGY
ncbi:MAG: hypothetical protein EA409_00655 [Saprospirales bacterium]|nr:MAG: hypothetical protein EA409_00655 [Saprospirales bacterium]